VHLHDNKGARIPTGPWQGTIDFDRFFQLIEQTGAKPVYTIEAHDAEDIEPSLKKVRTFLKSREEATDGR